MRNCYELPSPWSGITSFPVKTLNCHISRTGHTRIPVFALNWDLVTSILYTKIARIHRRELCVFGPYLIQSRPRGEEGNCSYLLPMSHRAQCYWWLQTTISWSASCAVTAWLRVVITLPAVMSALPLGGHYVNYGQMRTWKPWHPTWRPVEHCW